MAALPYLCILLSLAGTLAALICIMAFFLGTADTTLLPWVWLHVAAAVILLPTIHLGYQALVRQRVANETSVKTPFWIKLVIFVVLFLMLLGELSVLIAWVKVNEQTTYLYHLPSICIIVFAAAFWANAMRLIAGPRQDPFAQY